MPLTLVHSLQGHSDVVWCAAWSPSGRALATCGGDKQVRVWAMEADPSAGADAMKFVCKQVLDGTHTRTVRWVSWSPNGKYLASAGFDGITAIWENQNGGERKQNGNGNKSVWTGNCLQTLHFFV